MNQYEEQKELSKQIQSTVGKDGSRNWVYPKKPSGKFYNRRTAFSIALLTLLIGTPFVKWNGMPLFMFNIIERKFIFFGAIFWPQDIYIIVIGFITFIVFIVLFTVIYGRVFCGWACPQTIFLEMVFRKIEYWIEGDMLSQKRLAIQNWNFEKTWKKGLKHLIFLSLSIFIAHIFWAYIVSMDKVIEIISQPPSEDIGGFMALIIFSLLFYGVFSWFREQVCIIACPYGRLQGVMLDKNSLTVIYDYLRGEPREKNKKQRDEKAGDCIECGQCVDVCPTGIDIRNGTQLECINCTACMDACDNVMQFINKPKGLIRIESENGIEKGEKFKFNIRVGAYTTVLLILIGILTAFVLNREDIEATVLRGKGQIYRITAEGKVQNIYNIKLINKTIDSFNLKPKLLSHTGTLKLVENDIISIRSQALKETVMILEIEKKHLKPRKNEIEIGFFNSKNELVTKSESTFLAP